MKKGKLIQSDAPDHSIDEKNNGKLAPISFIYDPKYELQEVKETIKDKDFLQKYRYDFSLPKGITFENFDTFTDKQISEIIEQEMDNKKAQATTDKIINNWQRYGKSLTAFLKTLPGDFPDEFKIIYTRYGTGGSYLPPDKIIINIGQNYPSFSNFIHEAVHNMIEKNIVARFGLTQSEKESIVDWIMINTPAIQESTGENNYQGYGPPSETLLKRVGLK